MQGEQVVRMVLARWVEQPIAVTSGDHACFLIPNTGLCHVAERWLCSSVPPGACLFCVCRMASEFRRWKSCSPRWASSTAVKPSKPTMLCAKGRWCPAGQVGVFKGVYEGAWAFCSPSLAWRWRQGDPAVGIVIVCMHYQGYKSLRAIPTLPSKQRDQLALRGLD